MECYPTVYSRRGNRTGRVRAGLVGLVGSVLLLGLASPAAGQGERRAPVRESSKEQSAQQAPTSESKAAPLPAKKLEEALRLLLKVTADSTTTYIEQQRAMEIEGLVVDQTLSKLGHDFYDLFYTQFEAPAGSGDYVVTITEKPGRGTNTLILLTVNDIDLLEMPLQPKFDLIEAAASEAVSTAVNHLQQTSNLSRQLEKGHKQPLETF